MTVLKEHTEECRTERNKIKNDDFSEQVVVVFGWNFSDTLRIKIESIIKSLDRLK